MKKLLIGLLFTIFFVTASFVYGAKLQKANGITIQEKNAVSKKQNSQLDLFPSLLIF